MMVPGSQGNDGTGVCLTAYQAARPPIWSGHREARRSISARPGPWSRAWNGSCISWRCRSRIRTCAGWWRCRARPRSACARVCWRCSRGRAWRPGSWRSTTPPAWGTATPTARPPGPACSPCSARTTGSSPGSATPYVFVKLKQSRMACRFSPKQRRVLVQLSEKPAAIASSSIPSGRGVACTTLLRT